MKERFQRFYMPVTMFDSAYRKDGSYYLKVVLEILFIQKFFCRSTINLDFYGSFLSLELESSISRNKRNFLRVGSFYFSSTESYFPKCEKIF